MKKIVVLGNIEHKKGKYIAVFVHNFKKSLRDIH